MPVQGQEPPITTPSVQSPRPLDPTRAWIVRTAGEGCRDLLRLLPAGGVTLAVGAIVMWRMAGADPDTVRIVAVLVALAVVPLALRLGASLLTVVALVAAWMLAVAGVGHLPDVINPEPPVGQAVGGAAFFNTPYRGAQIGATLAVAVPVLIALLAWLLPPLATRRTIESGAQAGPSWLRRLRQGRSRVATGDVTWSTTQRSAVLLVGMALLAATLFPDLHQLAQNDTVPLGYSWDMSNLIAWQGLKQMGLTPMKDFFYPYGFQWLYDVRTVGPLFYWGAQVTMLGLAGWSLWRLTLGRTWRVLLCLLTLVLAAAWTPFVWRYTPAFLVPVAYGALGPLRHTRPIRDHLVFGAACVFAGLVEPDLLPIGIVAAVLVAVGELVGRRSSIRLGDLGRLVAGDAIPVLASVAAVLLIWVATGTATENIRFLGDFAAISSLSAANETGPGAAANVTFSNLDSSALWIATPALLAAAGLIWARLMGREEPAVAPILLGATGVALALVLKHLVRPVDDLALIAPFIALLWVAILTWRRDSLPRAVATGAALAVLFTQLNSGGDVANYFDTATATPDHVVHSVQFAFNYGERVRAAKLRFAPQRFAGWPDSVIVGYYVGTVHQTPLPHFAIVGDSQMTYVLLRQPPPFETELYDAARLDEQHRMVNDLKRSQPPYVIWRRDFLLDAVPYDVRDPLVFAWMIENYVPVQKFPTVDILRRRSPGEPIPARYWRKQLGAGVDLGFIPSLSKAARSSTCAGGTGCVDYAVLHGRPARDGEPLRLRVDLGGETYAVGLNARSGVHDYAVRLDRLWFWSLPHAGATFTTPTPGFTVKRASLRTGDNLY